MRKSISFVTAGALLLVLFTPSFGKAVLTPTEFKTDTASHLVPRQKIPKAIKIGLKEESNSERDIWAAWVDGQNPCHRYKATSLQMRRKEYDSPCNHRFSLNDIDYQYTMFNCEASGWNDVHLVRNGRERVAECVRDKSQIACGPYHSYFSEWRCDLKDPS